ncbi:MAG: Zn-dependent hydrolase [Bacteroidales bacterium]|nr:Zn-dependent hydrolase [Bacteroidales bacterium]
MKTLFTSILLFVTLLMVGQSTYTSQELYTYSAVKELDTQLYAQLADDYVEFKLTTDISHLSDNDKKMLVLMFDVASIMDQLFWIESNGNKSDFLASIKNPQALKVATINYGPWDRLGGEKVLFGNVPEKPSGANFYPVDMSKEEFEKFDDPSKNSQYTMIRRNAEGKLVSIPYHEFFANEIKRAATLLNVCSDLASDPGLKNYLKLRALALQNDDYFESDMAWMDMKTNSIDFVVGPIENYEDQLFGYKAAHESFILIKDKTWSDKLEHISLLLPELQKNLPVESKYKTEVPGSDSDLGVYDVVYYGGDCNAGSKTIAINLPNDPKVQLAKGSRKLQLKNAMQAKFDNILLPIANVLIDEEQLKYVKFEAFFENTMFHEIAHGLGIKNTINGKGDVRSSLKEKYTIIEEGKADILGLFLIDNMDATGLQKTELMNNYVTFMAGIFRSIRFGASSSHGVANLIRYNYFKEKGAFTQNSQGKYTIDFEKMQEAVKSLANEIIVMQGNGDYDAAARMIEKYGKIDEALKNTLESLKTQNIPVDVVFNQGHANLNLTGK